MILGGGISGLAVGYYARKNAIPFTIYEANSIIGGNCITFRHGDFLFDSGAHRFHCKDKEITNEIKTLLSEDLERITVPSQIYHNGRYLYFPLSPLNFVNNLGFFASIRSVVELIRSRLTIREADENFEKFLLKTYGKIISELFLLNYSEKLWGRPCNRLALDVAGKRMKGLTTGTLLREIIFGQRSTSAHMEGAFYYPKGGIGTIAERMGRVCGMENIVTNAKATKIHHDHKRVKEVEIDGKTIEVPDELVSTIPLDIFLNMLEPKAPKEILQLAESLRYRNILLVALFLDKEFVTDAATVYFPNSGFPFTRVYEPRNRNSAMSPPGKTSLVAEIPCQSDDEFWSLDDEELTRKVSSFLVRIGWVKKDEIIDTMVVRMGYAYPVLETGSKEKVREIMNYLEKFENVKLSGRSGRFVYAWIHNLIRSGREIVEEYISEKQRL